MSFFKVPHVTHGVVGGGEYKMDLDCRSAVKPY